MNLSARAAAEHYRATQHAQHVERVRERAVRAAQRTRSRALHHHAHPHHAHPGGGSVTGVYGGSGGWDSQSLASLSLQPSLQVPMGGGGSGQPPPTPHLTHGWSLHSYQHLAMLQVWEKGEQSVWCAVLVQVWDQ